MSHTYVAFHVHCVWSTKNRMPLITPEIAVRLYPYLAGIAKLHQFQIIDSGGVADHIHTLIALSPPISLAKAVQLIKGGSSKWVRETFQTDFAWQEGYGAFTVSVSDLKKTQKYLANQEAHHAKVSFQDEYRAFLKRHELPCDERYVWG